MSNASSLHQLDLDLCEYVAANVGCHLRNRSGHEKGVARALDFAIAQPKLAEYLASMPEPRLLLGGGELNLLEDATSEIEWRHPLTWISMAPYHRHYLTAIPLIKRELSDGVADAFVVQSEEIAAELEQAEVTLVTGIELVKTWIWEVRQMKRSMGLNHELPWPNGPMGTPSRPGLTEPIEASKANREVGIATEPDQPDQPLEPHDVAALLRTSTKHVIRLIKEGRLPAMNIGLGDQKPRYRIQRDDLTTFLNATAAETRDEAPGASKRRKLPEGLVDHFPD